MAQDEIQYTRPWLADYQLDAIFNDGRVAVCEGPQPYDEVVHTPGGPTTIGSLSVGDLVMGPDGEPHRVSEVDDIGERAVYELEFRDGAVVRAAGSHPWVLHDSRGSRIYSTEEVYNLADNTLINKYIPTTEPVEFNRSNVHIDPWTLGVLLGDGHISGKSIVLANNDSDIVGRFRGLLPDGYEMNEIDEGRGDSYAVVAKNRFAARSRPENGVRYRKNGWEVSVASNGYVGRYETKEEAISARDDALREKYGDEYISPEDNIIYNLEQLGLWGKTCHDKFVPDAYKYGSVEQRLGILRGLLDTDGSAAKKGSTATFEVTSQRLASDVQFLVRSLGGRCSISHRDKSHIDGHHDSWRCNISHSKVSHLFWCPSKKRRSSNNGVKNVRKIRDVRPVGKRPVRCIEVDSEDHLYLTTGMTTTHNSVQSGKTLACEIWLFEHAWNNRNNTYWWVSRNAEVAGLAYDEILEILPQEVKDEAITKTIASEGKQRIEFLNGSVIKFKSADAPDSLYGDTVSGCVVDEASRVDEEAWNAVTTRLSATGGPIRVIGNVKGRNNWFWRLARYVEDGDEWTCDLCGNSFRSNYHYSKITVIDSLKAGISDLEYVKQEYATMDKQSFMQAYLSEAPDDGGNPFGISSIDECAVDPDELPSKEESKVAAWGWDIAKDMNYTVGIGLDYDGNVVAFHRWQKESFASQIRRMTSLVGTTVALVDATKGSHGDQLLERLQDEGGSNWRGQTFSGKNKQNLMQGLAVAIQNNDITIPKGQIVKELKNFEYEEHRNYTVYTAPDGLMDDCVDALALAVKQWRDMTKMPSDAAPLGLGGQSSWSL